jgi:predicted nucleotidyltransferase
MTAAELVQAERERILEIAARHGARHVRVFGSVARGEATGGSDVDFLVDFEPAGAYWITARWLPTSRSCWGGRWTT